MIQIDADSAGEYLRRSGQIGPDEAVRVTELTGGVSNVVLHVSRPERDDFVLKQARGQLRVPQPWFAPLERIWREADVLRIFRRLLADANDRDTDGDELVASTPRIVFEDRDQYTLAITAAPAEHVVWKSELLAGRADGRIAAACGTLLARIHAGTWNDGEVARQVGDRAMFDELRLDPYYRTVARDVAEFREPMTRLIESVWDHPRCLVHGDFSPKNLLVWPGGLMMVDFEVGHFGDPAFDLGFFLSHLVLKAFYHAPRHEPLLALAERFWQAYRGVVGEVVGNDEFRELEARGVLNFAGCAVARLDGKSRIEYLEDAGRRDAVRALCRDVFAQSPRTWSEVLSMIRDRI